MREVAARGEVFPCIDEGSGPPLLLLHGAPGDCRSWAPHARLLSNRFRCLAYTQRHFGEKKWREGDHPFGTRVHAADLVAVVEALGLGPVRLVAWSYSCQVALLAALRRPDLFEAILLYEPGLPSWTNSAEAEAFGRAAASLFAPVIEALASGDEEAALRALIDASGGDGHFDRQPETVRRIHGASAHVVPLLFGGGEPPAAIECDQLARIEVPVAVRWGSATSELFAIPSRAAARCIGGGAHREVPGVGHLWPEQDPEAFVREIIAWAGEGREAQA